MTHMWFIMTFILTVHIFPYNPIKKPRRQPMPLKYPILTEREVEEINDIKERLSRFVSSNSEEAISVLGGAMCDDHRTLVQAKGRLVRGFLKQLKDNHDNGNFDLRNEAICKWASNVLTKVDGPHLPFI